MQTGNSRATLLKRKFTVFPGEKGGGNKPQDLNLMRDEIKSLERRVNDLERLTQSLNSLKKGEVGTEEERNTITQKEAPSFRDAAARKTLDKVQESIVESGTYITTSGKRDRPAPRKREHKMSQKEFGPSKDQGFSNQAISENSEPKEKVVPRISAGLLGKDFEEIEEALLSPGVWELRDRVAQPHPIAPPHGSPLLYRKILSVKETLNRFSPLFRR